MRNKSARSLRAAFIAAIAAALCIIAPPAAGGGVRNTLFRSGYGSGAVPGLPFLAQNPVLSYFSYNGVFTAVPAAGDILLAYGFRNDCTSGGGAPQTAPTLAAGWTLIDSRTAAAAGGTPPGAALAYKIAGASEPASQTPFTGISSPAPFGVAIVDLSNPSGQAWSAFSVTDQLVDGNNPGSAPITASPSATPSASSSLVIAFGGWISCGTGAGASALSISGGGTWATSTSFLTGASNDVSILVSQQNVLGTSAISPSIQWTANNAPGLDGAVIVFNHP